MSSAQSWRWLVFSIPAQFVAVLAAGLGWAISLQVGDLLAATLLGYGALMLAVIVTGTSFTLLLALGLSRVIELEAPAARQEKNSNAANSSN